MEESPISADEKTLEIKAYIDPLQGSSVQIQLSSIRRLTALIELLRKT